MACEAASCGTFRQPDRLEAVVRKHLQQSSYGEIRRLRCERRHGKLILKGSVSCFYLKQIVHSILQGLDGEEKIVNQVTIHPSPVYPISETQASGKSIV